jgi:hypothetical protein
LPIHGVFSANNNDVTAIIERVAKQHLGLHQARRTFHEAVKVVEPFDQRDPIASAHNQVLAASGETYFYAGLTFGLTLADCSQAPVPFANLPESVGRIRSSQRRARRTSSCRRCSHTNHELLPQRHAQIRSSEVG